VAGAPRRLAGAARGAGLRPRLEVKWHGIRTGFVPPALADAVAALSRAPLTAYVTLLDLERGADLPEYFGSPERTYGTALTFVSERFHHLLDAEAELGLIVADSRHREEDLSLRRFFGALTETGTPYMRLDRIVEGLFLGPSHLSVGLPVRRPRRLDYRRRRARERTGARLPEAAAAPLRQAPGDGRARRRRDQALPRRAAGAGAAPAVLASRPWRPRRRGGGRR
jgi:hypothetical protein